VRARDEGDHLLRAGGELDLLDDGVVVRVGRDDAQGLDRRVVENGEYGVSLRDLFRDLVEGEPVDLGSGQLLRRDEARSAGGREEPQKGRFVDRIDLEQRLLDAPPVALVVAKGAFPLLRRDGALLDHLVQKTDVSRRMHG
jgi:hypothetical protein